MGSSAVRGLPPPPDPMGFAHVGLDPSLAAPMDPEKEFLVNRIKAFQKMGNGELWSNFCGYTKDPARHEVSKLQEFIVLHNVP